MSTPVAAWCLVGPTAVGKSRVAQHIAERRGWRLLSADSMLVYRGLDVGTAKPSVAERLRVPYFGVDLAEPTASFSVAAWLEAVTAAFVTPPCAPVLVVGGTGLYLRCLVEGLRVEPVADGEVRARWQGVFAAGGVAALQAALRERAPAVYAALADPRNGRRLLRALERVEAGETTPRADWVARPAHVPFVGLRQSPAAQQSAIESRVRAMYAGGLVEEVRRLMADGCPLSPTARHAIGYAEAAAWLAGRCSREAAMERTVIRTRQYAKRQVTWFERQANVSWIDVVPDAPVEAVADAVLSRWETLGPTALAGVTA